MSSSLRTSNGIRGGVDQVEDGVEPPEHRVAALAERWALPRIRGKIVEIGAGQLDRRLIVGNSVVSDPRAVDMDLRAAEPFLGDRLAERGLHQWRSGHEHGGGIGHRDEVRQRRSQGAMARRRAEHEAHHRHPAGQLRQSLQVVGGRIGVGVGQAMPGALEHEDQRHPLLERQLGQALALGRAGIADRAAKDGEVLDPGDHRAAADQPEPRDQPIGRGRRRAILAEIAGEGADLDEAAVVEQGGGALTRVELAGLAVPGEALVAAHRRGEPALAVKLGEDRAPFHSAG
jgi:hypothetical protein